MHNENFKADFLKMASATHVTFRNTSHPLFMEQKRDLSITLASRTCRFETCRYLKLPNFKLTHFGRAKVLGNLRHYLQSQSHRHQTIGRQEVERRRPDDGELKQLSGQSTGLPIKRSWVRVPAGAARECSFPGSVFHADSYFRYPFHPCVTAVAHKSQIQIIVPKVQAAC